MTKQERNKNTSRLSDIIITHAEQIELLISQVKTLTEIVERLEGER